MSYKSARLEAAKSLLTGARVLADVGTDHGYFPILAVQEQRIVKAYATDNKEQPLARAIENIALAGLSSLIVPILAEGLSFLTPDVDTVSILGMGGNTIRDILQAADLAQVKLLILGPNNDAAVVRGQLEASGWQITDERFVRDQGHDYQIMAAKRGIMLLSDAEKEYGPILLKTRNPQLIQHINHQIGVLMQARRFAKDDAKRASLDARIATLRRNIE